MIKAVIGISAEVTHELLETGSSFLRAIPIPALAGASYALLAIWDAVKMVKVSSIISFTGVGYFSPPADPCIE